ncbi:MAG: hypothetical protein Q7U00_05990 [Sulfurimonas sp.]|nr:hypothetical protein [Sulfurimonas sp.]
MKKQFSLFFTLVAVILYLFFEKDLSINKQEDAKHDEKYYQTKMCNEFGGDMEYVLFDKTRVDCLTKEYAIEVDFAKKWAEGIGQSLYYAEVTGKKPAIGVISGEGDEKYLDRIRRVGNKFGIKIIVLEK